MATKTTQLDKSIAQTDGEVTAGENTDAMPAEQTAPSYRKFTESRVPISKSAGTLWQSRRDAAKARLETRNVHDAWDEAIRYYKNDQTGKRNRDDPDNPSTGTEIDITGSRHSQTENVVFANVSSLVPSIYAKNPDCSVFSPKGDEDRAFTTTAQKLLRTLMQKRTAPGINLKPKMRRNVVMTTLTNISYIEVGYNKRETASEGSLAEIDAIAAELAKPNLPRKDIERLEGELQALDEKIDLLQPAGPYAVVRHPKDVLIDPDAQLPDCSDAKWVMIKDVLDTAFLNAVYTQKDEDGKLVSVYKPTHILKTSAQSARNMAGHDEEITKFSLLTDDTDRPEKYGYRDEPSYKRAQRTFVWKIWDRITRRVYMYAENDWTWPIWVWDDPYGFDDFFPIFPLAFHSDPEDMYARGEVSYYLDQQDEINKINTQVSRMRHRVSNQLVYNKAMVKSEKELMGLIRPVKGNELVGVTVPDGAKISDVIMAPPIPAVEFQQLFDKRSLFEAVDRVSGVSSVVKGVEYRTNTTNKAIDSYESSSAMRLDEKIDAIEEQIGRIGSAILHMCLQFMTKEEVAQLIGANEAQHWPPNMSSKEAQKAFTLTVTGGSSLKPTSKVRKEQAKEIAQLIGQFGASNPAAFMVVLKVFQRAYSDEIVLEQSDWDMLLGTIQQSIQAQQPKPEGPPQGGDQGGQAQQIDPKAIIAKISEAIVKMPDKLRHKVGDDIGKGIPLEEIIAKLQEVMAAGSQQQQPH